MLGDERSGGKMSDAKLARCVLYLFALVVAVFLRFPELRAHAGTPQTPSSDRERSLRAFGAVASALTSPRCLNCHVPNDGPLQGDDNHPHAMNVKRGPDGKGVAPMRCSTCHQAANAAFQHGPPGAADWQLPPQKTPMAWKGLTIGELCRTLKDPAKNGSRSIPDLVPHMETSLVRWAWDPGPGRSVPPLSHDEFVTRLKEWISTGSACPE